MRDPKRLLESGTSLERALLDSHRFELPADALGSKVLSAVAAAPRPCVVPRPSLWSLPQVIFVGVAAMGLAALAPPPYVRRDMSKTETVAPVDATNATSPTNPTKEESKVDLPIEDVVTPSSLPDAPPAAPARAPAAKPKGSMDAPSASVERETALLDRVKADLGASDVVQATRGLDAYDAEFPRGMLRPEATILRVRVLLLRGDREAARKLGEDFIAAHPGGVHAKRIRSLVYEE